MMVESGGDSNDVDCIHRYVCCLCGRLPSARELSAYGGKPAISGGGDLAGVVVAVVFGLAVAGDAGATAIGAEDVAVGLGEAAMGDAGEAAVLVVGAGGCSTYFCAIPYAQSSRPETRQG
jgi:hypothetical protein